MLTAIMLERNDDEERFTRIEQMLKALQRQEEAPKTVMARVDAAEASFAQDATPRRRRTDARATRVQTGGGFGDG